MRHDRFIAALTLYRSRTLTLDGAAEYSGVPEAKLAAALRSHGVPVREDDVSA